MKVLLTGATGFLGSNVLRVLIEHHDEVTVLKRDASDTWRICQLKGYYTTAVAEPDSIERLFAEQTFDVIIHCATSYGRDGNAVEVVAGNVSFPLCVLDAAIRHGCRYFINTDSFFCKQLPERMNRGEGLYQAEYTLSKYQFREWGRLRANEGKITFINLQMEHLVGENDNPAKFIPWLMRQMKENVPQINLTQGEQIRDFVPVQDAARIYPKLLDDLQQYSGFQSFEVGTGIPVSLKHFIEDMKEKLNSVSELRFGERAYSEAEIMASVASTDSPYLTTKLSRQVK